MIIGRRRRSKKIEVSYTPPANPITLIAGGNLELIAGGNITTISS